MEDSGFDSDSKTNLNSVTLQHQQVSTSNKQASLERQTDLQRQIEIQREALRKSNALLARNRLIVPKKNKFEASDDQKKPLVTLNSDESDEEFDMPPLSKAMQKQITEQLIKDGYNLDVDPDDEDLDLIPPRPLQHRSWCCRHPSYGGCSLQ